MTSRWRPTRAGILNVWRYFDEVLTFEDGRLLLRGPNGSGKSKALELLLPFLLDADLRASRLSTFGSGSRSMHWNLMGQGASGTTRVGFVWLELGQSTGDAVEHVTIGARLQASNSEVRTRVTYFVAHARVGDDLHLTTDDTPLTVSALRDELTGRGTVFEQDAQGYRDEVRRILFPGMSPERYDTLVHALLQLRRPKLSEHLDPESLSSILSAALPPIDEGRIDELAEGFERLDQQRAQLELLSTEVRAAQSLLDATRSYAALVLRQRAQAVTSAATSVDQASRHVRNGQEQLQAAQSQAAEAQALLKAAQQEMTDLVHEQEGLRSSEQYKEGRNLEDLRQKTHDALTLAARSAADAADAVERSQGSALSAQESSEHAAQVQAARDATHASMVRLAAELDAAELVGTPDLAPYLDARGAQVREHGEQLDARDEAVADRGRAEAALEAARTLLDRAERDLDEARAQVDTVARERLDQVLAWAHSCTELPLIEDDILDALNDDTFTAYVNEAFIGASSVLDRGRGEAERNREGVAGERDEAERTRSALMAQPTVAPPGSRFRGEHPDPPGAMRLWQLVDFHDHVPDEARAGLEAALEASGLLDALVIPTGTLSIETHDVVIEASEPVADGPRLSLLLRPDAPTSPSAGRPSTDVIRHVLDIVGLATPGEPDPPSTVRSWVAPDGRWRLGPLRGSWTKETPQYIGASARERHRQIRIAELDALIETLTAREADLELVRDTFKARLATARAEARSAPPDTDLVAARTALVGIEAVVAERDRATTTATTERDRTQDAATAAQHAIVVSAERLRLPTTREALDRVAAAITGAREAARHLDQASRELKTAIKQAAKDERHAQTDADLARSSRERAQADEASARAAQVKLRALEEHLGDAYDRIVNRISTLDTLIDASRDKARTIEKAHRTAEGNAIALGVRIEGAEREHREAQQRRETANEELVAILVTTLANDAGVAVDIPPGDRVRAVLETARRMDRDLPALRTGETLANSLSRLTQRFHDTAGRLAARAQLELTEDAGATIPVAVTAGRRTGVRDLLRTVQEEQSRTTAEITAGEHDLFERALTGDTRRHLSETIRDAVDLVDRMNERLLTVRTASNVQVKLKWAVRDEEGTALREARSLLLKNPARLDESEHDALHRFFRERIDAAHAEDSGRSWAQQLATVFDYTAWHRFHVEMSRPDGQGWRTLTRQAHGVLSGGEKAIALHLPLFAALAAHYEATPTGPRLILLDEVFVGIDDVNRGQVFALLRDLDLDLFLTSDHEWATYPEVDSIAIHALAAGGDDEAVTTSRFVWTGTELTEDPADALFT